MAKLRVLPQACRSAQFGPSACSASACSVFTPGFPASHPAAPQLPLCSVSGGTRSPAAANPHVPSKAQHGTPGCGKGGGGGGGEIPASSQKSSLQSRSTTLPPAGGAPGAAGRSRSGRRCWWRGHRAQR